MEHMSTDDVADFLRSKGIPEKFCKVFSGKTTYQLTYKCRTALSHLENYIDGTEFFHLTEEEVCSMIPPMGLAKKIMRFIPSLKVH